MSKVTFCLLTALIIHGSQRVMAGEDYSNERFFHSPEERAQIEASRLLEVNQPETIESGSIETTSMPVVVERITRPAVKPAPASIDGVVIRHRLAGSTLIRWLDGRPHSPELWDKATAQTPTETVQVGRSVTSVSQRTGSMPAGRVFVVRALP